MRQVEDKKQNETVSFKIQVKVKFNWNVMNDLKLILRFNSLKTKGT
jgi:hypothetical protein